MNPKLNEHLDRIFAPNEGLRSVAELKDELRHDLQERFGELVQQGHDDSTAYQLTLDSIGDIEETIADLAARGRALEHKVLTDLSSSNLAGSDFKNVTVRDGKFRTSALRASDFSGAELVGGSFRSSDLRGSRFDGADLTDANLSVADLRESSFRDCNLTRANLHSSDLRQVDFSGAKLIETKLTKAALSNIAFTNCVLDGTDFTFSDLTCADFGGQTLTSVNFQRAGVTGASFKGATLHDVSFRHIKPRSLAKANFEDAVMDKLTYALLKGAGAKLERVTVV